jgi:hypothetical protein
MGYALFAAQKINYSNLVFNYQMQLNEISDERIQLAEFIANISDGQVTGDELTSDPTNLESYISYINDSNSYVTANIEGDETAGISAIDINNLAQSQYGENVTAEQIATIQASLVSSFQEKYAKYYQKQLEVEDQKLEAKQKKIETKLTAAQKQLEQIEQAEGQAIEKATPKYAGLG